MQKQIGSMVCSALRPRALIPRYFAKTTLEIMQRSAALLQKMSRAPEDRAAWAELQNKIEAFSLFEHVDLEIKMGDRARPSLQELVLSASRHDVYRAVWMMEGIGHYYAESHRDPQLSVTGLLSEETTKGLPASSFVPLHTGMGISFAEWVLELVCKRPADCTGLLRSFTQLCRNNSRSGYGGSTFEALGLVARNLYPHLMERIDSALSEDRELLAYFWHGVGRGIYFAPANAPPFRNAPWRGLEMCVCEPTHKLGRSNAVSGFAWALTLVNIRDPQIMEVFLKYHGNQMAEDDAFADGVRSAMIIWKHATAAACHLNLIQEHALRSSDPHFMSLWQTFFKRPCEDALNDLRVDRCRNAVSNLFRYQPVSRAGESSSQPARRVRSRNPMALRP